MQSHSLLHGVGMADPTPGRNGPGWASTRLRAPVAMAIGSLNHMFAMPVATTIRLEL